MSLPPLSTAAAVRAFARRLLGWDGSPLGTFQVMAISAVDNAVIAINEHAPRSPTDFFTLRLARAAADAVVLTGRIVRMEPDLRVSLDGPGAAGLRALRGDRPLPLVGVLTRGDGLDFSHPLFRHPGGVVLLVPSPTPDLCDAAAAHGVRVRALPAPGVHGTVQALREGGAEVVSIEAGISTAAALYPDKVDHLMLGRFHGPLPAAARGPAFDADLSQMVPVAPPTEVDEASGRWSFQLYRRSAGTS